MTTLIINQDRNDIPTNFETWEDLQDYVLKKLMVKMYPVKEDEINSVFKERIERIRRDFKENPQSFDDI